MASALTTQTGTNLPTLSSEPPLSAKLSALLVSSESPVIGPNTASALQEWIDAPRPDLEPATIARIENMIARLSLATKERLVSGDEAKERLSLYWRALRDVPLADLGLAFDDVLKSSTFMPTPAEVRKAARAHTSRREYRLSRARHLIWLHRTNYVAPVPEVDLVKLEDLDDLVRAVEQTFPSKRNEAA